MDMWYMKQKDAQNEIPIVPLKQQLSEIIELSIPAIIGYAVVKFQTTLNLFFIGHYGSKEMLAGVGLGEVALSFLGQVFLMGLNNGIQTLVAQAHGGGNLHLCGVYLNRGRFLITVFIIPLAILLLKTEPILVYLGQDEKSSYFAQ
jgi:MATE family multidrug resistance protein